MEEHLLRKLAVILHADVVGSTTLVQQNETLAHERIQKAFHHFSETIKNYGGIAHELRGDALVAEFERASDAVAAALSYQAENAEFNTTLDDDIRPQLRMGISLGEVVIADDTITGAGVVLAQRLEQLAESGEVCIQGAAYETLPQRLPFEFTGLGEQQVKGFEEPVRAYAVTLKTGEEVPGPEPSAAYFEAHPDRVKNPRIAIGAAVLLVTIAVMFAWWQPWVTREQPAFIDQAAFPLSEKPSIAVLPFTNMSGDPEQEYFADGMSEDLITDLSKISGLFVIARNSSFSYKGQQVIVQKIAQDLGVRYVLEGSVRRSGDSIRINAQLIDAASGGHLWADRFDGRWGDVFAMQDAITRQIVTALAVELDTDERDQIARPYTNSVKAYDYFLRGRDHFFRRNKDDNILAATMFKDAIELDPAFAQAYSLLAWVHTRDVINGWSESPTRSLGQAYEAAQMAINLDDKLAQAYFVMALVYRSQKDHVKAAREAEKAIEIDPGYADAYVLLASLLYYSGGAEEGLKLIKKAKQLNPNYPSNYPFHLGQAYFLLHQYQDAAAAFQAALDTNPTSERSHVWLAATYGQAGQVDDAEFEVEEVLVLDPDFSIQRMRKNVPLKAPIDIEHFIGGLRKAGLPE